MKIIFVESKETVFGGQQALLARATELRKRGIEFRIIHPYPNSAFLKEIDVRGLSENVLRPRRRLHKLAQPLYISYCFLKLVRSGEYSLAHLDAFDSAYLVAALKFFGVARDVSTFFTIRSERYLRFGELDRLFLKQFDALATNSEYSAERISEATGISVSDIYVNYSPIDFSKIPILRKASINNCISIGYFGSMEPRKRVDRFVAFTRDAGERFPDVTFSMHIFGEPKGPQQELYAERVKRMAHSSSVNCNYLFRGYGTIEEASSSIDVLFCPYDNEPMGRVVPEFLFAGVPVLVNNSGGLVDAGLGLAASLSGNTEQEKSKSFIQAIANYLGTSASISDEDRRVILSRYDAPHVVQKELDMYAHVLERKCM